MISWREFWEERAARIDPLDATGRGKSRLQHVFATLEDVCAKLDLGSGDDLADIGCGVGLLGGHLYRHVKSYCGVDASSNAIMTFQRAYPKAGLLKVGDICDIPLPSRCVNKTLCYSVLQYLPYEHLKDALAELRRITTDGGLCLVAANPDSAAHHGYMAATLGEAVIHAAAATWTTREELRDIALCSGWSKATPQNLDGTPQASYMFDLVLQ